MSMGAMRVALMVGLASGALLGCGDDATDPSGGTPKGAAYPSGPYGTVEGAVLENLHFRGWIAPDQAGYDPARLGDISFSDVYDPDGAKGTKLIFVGSHATWCAVCNQEYRQIDSTYFDRYTAQGVVFFGTLFENSLAEPASESDLVGWAQTFDVRWPAGLDPELQLGRYFEGPVTATAMPRNLLVRARDMVIVARIIGSGEELVWSKVDAALADP